MQSTRYARGLFSIDDLYTRHHSDGSRDLSLDNALKKLENDFGMIKPKIQSSSVLAGSDAAWLIAFAAAMYARTPAAATHDQQEFGKILRVAHHVEASFAKMSEADRASAARRQPPRMRDSPSLSMADIRKIVEQPLQTLMAPRVIRMVKEIGELDMRIAVLRAPSDAPFVTSDSPCFYFDPSCRDARDLLHWKGLESPTCELNFPLTPTRFLIISHYKNADCYIDISEIQVAEMNRRTWTRAHDYAIALQGQVDSRWLSPIALWPKSGRGPHVD